MSKLDKIHRKLQAEKLAKEFVHSKIYKQAMDEMETQAVLAAYARIGYFAAEYLELNFHCKRDGILKLLNFLHTRMTEVGEDETYFKDVKKYYLDNYNLDVEQELGIEITGYKGEVEE